MFLEWVQPVGGGIEQVIDEVDGAGEHAENSECEQRRQQIFRLQELDVKYERYEYYEIFCPLPWAQSKKQRIHICHTGIIDARLSCV